MRVSTSVTRLGDLLDFGQRLKPLATIDLPKFSTFLGNFCKGVKIYHFSSEIILGNFYRHLAIFSGRTGIYNVSEEDRMLINLLG